MTEGTLLLIKLGYSQFLVPLYSLVFTSLKALSTVDAAKITPLPTRNVLQRLVTTEKSNLRPWRNQLNEVLRTFNYTKPASGTFLRVNDSYILLRVYRYGTLGTDLYTIVKTQAGIGALLVPPEKLSGRLACLDSGITTDNLRVTITVDKGLFAHLRCIQGYTEGFFQLL